MVYDVSKAAAYSVLYGVLGLFTFMALGSAGRLSCLPESVTHLFMLKHTKGEGTADYFLSARNAAGPWAIALSFFASGMGAWVLYGTSEMGANPQLSWLGVLGYSCSSASPAIIICWLGPKVRRMTKNKAFSTTDFGRQRYGRLMQVTIAGISGFYMFIFIVAELTSISSVFHALTNDYSKKFGNTITISVGAITILYISLAGVPGSIITDKFQGIIMAVLVTVLTVAVTAAPENRVTRAEFALASNWTVEGFMAAVTLFIAIASAELFNQMNWQRVWAAESVRSMRLGFFMGSVMVFFLMMFFGIMGMIAYAKDPTAYNDGDKLAYLSFFDILEPLKSGWHILVLILVTALASSSVDSLQTGLTSIFSHDLMKFGVSPGWISRIMLVALNIPAIYLASKQFDVIALFLVADIVCATSVFPVYLGLQTTDWGLLKAPTELGAFLGCMSGMVTVMVNGALNNASGGIFGYFWLKNAGICSLCGVKTMTSFIVTPSISLVMTYVFTYLDLWLRGERARQPLIPVAFDKDDDQVETNSPIEEDEIEQFDGEDKDDMENGPEDVEVEVETNEEVHKPT